jgi:hypothetical protein
MEAQTATMPRTTYRALDFQRLTLNLRSKPPTADLPDHRENFLSETYCNRGQALSHLSTPDQDPPELPNSHIPRLASRPALEQLRFGSLELALDRNSTHEALLSEKSTEARIFTDSDFPPLQQSPPTPSILVDSDFAGRRVTLPEVSQPRCYHRTSSAPTQDTRPRSRKPSLRSTRYRGTDIDNQSSRQASLAPIGTDASSSVDATTILARKDSILPPVEAQKRRVRNDMASAFPQMSGDARRHYPSGTTRYENRPPVNRATPCKNGPLCRKFQEGRIPCPNDFSWPLKLIVNRNMSVQS